MLALTRVFTETLGESKAFDETVLCFFMIDAAAPIRVPILFAEDLWTLRVKNDDKRAVVRRLELLIRDRHPKPISTTVCMGLRATYQLNGKRKLHETTANELVVSADSIPQWYAYDMCYDDVKVQLIQDTSTTEPVAGFH